MKYKMILSDFDGTLLRTDGTISDDTAAAIKDYMNRGGIFVINTGRMSKSVSKYAEKLGINRQPLSISGLNGSLVTDNAGKLIINQAIDYKTSAGIIREAENLGLYVHTYDANDVLIEKEHPIATDYQRICDVTLRYVGKLSEFIEKNEQGCVKILIVVEEEKMQYYYKHFSQKFSRGVTWVISNENFLEVISSSGGKGKALLKIAEYYGVDTNSVIAVGDQINDVTMIENAGLGCAVQNAVDGLKVKADYITSSNDEDGVKRIIDKFTWED